MKQSSPLQELIAYRNRYINRDEKKINREFLTMIDNSIMYMQELEQKCKREERMQLCYGIDQRLLYKVLELPDVVFSKFIDYVEKHELYVDEAEDLIQDILFWERRTQDTMDEYRSLRHDREIVAMVYDKPEFDEIVATIRKNIEEFQQRTRLVVNFDYIEDVETIDEYKKEGLRYKYLNYLFEKYDKRRNRQTP